MHGWKKGASNKSNMKMKNKSYSEEVYSQSQQSLKQSLSDSSLDNMAEICCDPPDNEKLHEDCERRLAEMKSLLSSIQEKHKMELDLVRSDYDLRLTDALCVKCRKTNLTIDEDGSCQSSLSLEHYYNEKIKTLCDKFSESNMNKDFNLKIYQIKEDVRKDYEIEMERMREDIVEKELKRKDDEIKLIKEAHQKEVDNLWKVYEELANEEANNMKSNVKTEAALAQELQLKTQMIEILEKDKKELKNKLRVFTDQKQKEFEILQQQLEDQKSEAEKLRRSYELEKNTRIEVVLEEKTEMEAKLSNKIVKLEEEINKMYSSKIGLQKQELHRLAEKVRHDVYEELEQQVKAMMDKGEPPCVELMTLEQHLKVKYEQQLAQVVEEHALEMADLKADYDTRLAKLISANSIRETEEDGPKQMMATVPTTDSDLDKVIRERNNLRILSLTLRQVLAELQTYLTTCEDEFNRSFVGHLLLNSHQQLGLVATSASESESSDGEVCRPVPQRRVHFAPDMSSITTLMDEDILDNSMDVSVHLQAELDACLRRLREDATGLLCLTQTKEKAFPSGMEDRRLSSVTRQLIEEKKAKEQANSQLTDLQILVQRYEKELDEVHKELAETKEQMIKEKVAEETEFNNRQTERRAQKLCFLLDKARAQLCDCPAVWMTVIEELCVEGDALIEEAQRARDEHQLEVEAADKQLRSTRAFLEEQAAEREQERDEAAREIARLTDALRDRERDWTTHKQFTSEVEALEIQVKETTELLRDAEEKKESLETELRAAADKIWVLRDIISELEAQVAQHSSRENELEQRIAQLGAELESEAQSHTDLLMEAQSQRDSEMRQSPHDLHTPTSPRVIHHVKSQLRGMAKTLERQIKELEAVNIHVSSASLSSPSEDISIREQLEAQRCMTPEDQGHSPPSPLGVEELGLLADKLLRYSRAAENIIKKLRDRELEIVTLTAHCEELQAAVQQQERQLRDRELGEAVLRSQSDKQLIQIASLTNKVEELRVRNEREMQASAAPLRQHLQELERHNTELTGQLSESQRQVSKLKQVVERSEALQLSQKLELSQLSEHQQQLMAHLSSDLHNMQAEKHQLQAVVDKYRREDVSYAQLIDVMLEEKNADIDLLQQRVAELSAQQDQGALKNQKGRGLRVSFADEVAQSQLGEGDRARDAPHHDTSSIKPIVSTPLSIMEDRDVRRMVAEDLSTIPEPSAASLSPPGSLRAELLEKSLSQLNAELEQKTQRLLEAEARLSELPALQAELLQLQQERDTLSQQQAELEQLRLEIDRKDEDIVKTTADVKALEIIIKGLHQKLEEAKMFSEESDSNDKQKDKQINDKIKEECEMYKNTISSLESQMIDLSMSLEEAKADNQTMKDAIAKLDKEKVDISCELVLAQSKCTSMQEELNVALENAEHYCNTIKSLSSELEEALEENKKLSSNCKQLKKELDHMTRKQKTDLKNYVKKETEEATRVREELESLRSSNSELQSTCESLQQELNQVGNNLELFKELTNKDSKINQLETELKQLDEHYNILKDDKQTAEQTLNKEINLLKTQIKDLVDNSIALGSESKDSMDSVHERENRDSLGRRYEILKRECERQRRSRREMEKKYVILREELVKERRYSARLQSGLVDKQRPSLQVTKVDLIDIKPGCIKSADSLDNLTDEVQKELNTSARLDQSLISNLQNSQTVEVEIVPSRSDNMPPRIEYLTARLAEAEMKIQVEKTVTAQLRHNMVKENDRYMEACRQIRALQEEVAGLHTLNDEFENKFKGLTLELERQVNQVRQVMTSDDASVKENEALKKALKESLERVDSLLQERVLLEGQLRGLQSEVARLRSERHTRGDNRAQLESKELHSERQRNAALEGLLQAANESAARLGCQLGEAAAQIDELTKQRNDEAKIKKSLEERIKAIEVAEKSRYARRKANEEKLKEKLAHEEKARRGLEQECLSLQLRLKQLHAQQTAHTSEYPLSVRLHEANAAVERLVGEREELSAALSSLRKEYAQVQQRLRDKDLTIEDLICRNHALNIKITDGGLNNQNAIFAAERTAWLREKEMLKMELAQLTVARADGDVFNGLLNSQHLVLRILRAEKHHKALVWQKKYLSVALKGYTKMANDHVAILQGSPLGPPPPPSPERRFRAAVHVVRAVFRMQFIMRHNQNCHERTCRILRIALNTNSNTHPRTVPNVPEQQTLWKKYDNSSTSSSLPPGPGSMAQLADQFNAIQDRMKNTLKT